MPRRAGKELMMCRAVPAGSTPVSMPRDIQDLITHWSLATGRDMKATMVMTPA